MLIPCRVTANDTCPQQVVRMNNEGANLLNKLEQELGFVRMKNRELNIENKRLKKEREWLVKHYAIEARLAGESLSEAEEVIIKDIQQILKEEADG